MTILSKKHVVELQRIIKEATGRELSLRDAHFATHHLVRLAQIIMGEERSRAKRRATKQPSLFD